MDCLLAFFLVVAVFFLPVKDGSGASGSLAIVFVSIVFEAIPFMFVGALIGGLLEEFVSRERMTALLSRRRWLTVCVAAGAGIVFPVCECAVVPVVRRLVGKGLPLRLPLAICLAAPS
ncbi:MAG: permease [Deltaproteobacteria bacterium]